MSHSGLLYLFWEQDFGRSNRPISKMHIFTYISIIYISIVFMLLFLFNYVFKFFIREKDKKRILYYKRYILYFLISFFFIFFYLSKDLSLIIKLRSYFWIDNTYVNIYIQDYNRFIKELYIRLFFLIFSMYIPFIGYFNLYIIYSTFFKEKGISFIIYFIFNAYFFAFLLAQSQRLIDIYSLSRNNALNRKFFSNLNLTAILFNFKGYFYDIYIVTFFRYMIYYIIIFRRKLTKKLFIIFSTQSNSLGLFSRLILYFIYRYFINSLNYFSVFCFSFLMIFFIEYSFFYRRFIWYRKGINLLK